MIIEALNVLRCLARCIQKKRHVVEPIPNLKGDRSIEESWVIVNLPRSPQKVLDVGSGAGVLAGYIAGLGHNVTCIDPFDAPWHFPTIHMKYIKGDILTHKFIENFDVIVACSSIEHIGIPGRYDVTHESLGNDILGMELLSNIIVKNGILIVTIPVGIEKVVMPYHRIYGEQRLRLLFDRYNVLQESYWRKADKMFWSSCSRDEALKEIGSKDYYALGLFVLKRKG
jgi:hypothetical protein